MVSRTDPERPKRRVLVYRALLLPYSETFIVSQAKSLVSWDAVLVGSRRAPGVAAALRGLRVVLLRTFVVQVKGRSFELRTLSASRTQRELLKTTDLVHAHFGRDAFTASRLARRLGAPLVVTFHGYDATQSTMLSAGLGRWVYGLRLGTLWRRASLVVAVSDHIRNRVIERGCPPDRIVTHYIGVDTDSFVPTDKPKGITVLAVGRLVEKKGFADLIDSFSKVLVEHPEARLVVLGDGSLREGLVARAEPLRGKVSLPGSVSSDEVRAHLEQAAVLVVPSVTAADGDTEGLPMIVLEAMATGTPVVATSHAGIPEAVQDGVTGLLVPERAPEELATAICRLLADATFRAQLGAAARDRAVGEFDLAKQATKLEAFYQGVVDGSSRTWRR